MLQCKSWRVAGIMIFILGISIIWMSIGCGNKGLEESIPSVINNVVHIKNVTGHCQGSGVLIAPDLILTARHVVEDSDEFIITTNDGKKYNSNSAISSKKYDLGFIKLNIMVTCTTRVGDINDCRLGQTVFAIGSPYGEENFNSVTAGIVSSLARNLEEFGLSESYGWSCTFQTDTAGHPGNSGCPVYSLDGKVRGILVGGQSNAIIYCVPACLIANDCQVIQLMFLMDEYKKETEIIDEVYYYQYSGYGKNNAKVK
ncbi:MAG: trypsin-like peptidase domain-containing protein [Candidatus Bathyarchaeota archaeon]